jgi:hypothetical protein
MRQLGTFVAAVLALASAPASASVFLNGVNIDDVRDTRIDGCSVTIDAQGNVRIQAEGYAVKVDGAGGTSTPPPATTNPQGPTGYSAGYASGMAPPPSQGPSTGRLAKRYFLVAEQSHEGGTQYEVDVFVNSQWIRKIQGTEGAVPIEVTKYFRPGQNHVYLAATKAIVGERRFFGRDVWLRIVIGEGNVGGEHVMIDTPLVSMTRTAADMEDKKEEYVVEAR